jgi:type I restriction enzyme M protein
VPPEYSWQRLLDAEGTELEVVYTEILLGLAQQPGTLGTIFRKAQNRVQDPAKLKRLIGDLIGAENWSASGTDLKGDAYEELLSKGASDKGSGAGQYFTPRELIRAMVDVVDPRADDTVVDPACGTGGFLLVAHEHAAQGAENLTPTQRDHLREGFVSGYELVDGTARLAAMNLLLHGIGTPNGASLIDVRDALIADPGRRWSVVLSNPPFGRKSSLTMVNADGREVREDREIERQDFVVTTSNKQLNFLQHIMTILDIDGRAAVVLPDNVLFEGGAGETLRRKLLADFDLHPAAAAHRDLLRPGREGERAVLRQAARLGAAVDPEAVGLRPAHQPALHLKQSPLRRHHLDEFVDAYLPGKNRSERVESERWKSFTYDDLIARDKVNLDITWLRDESLEDADNLPAPEIIAREIVEDLIAALAEFEAVAAALEASASPNAESPGQ